MHLREARQVVSEGYYSARGVTLAEVIRRWQDDGDKLLDADMPVKVPVADLWPHREYTWSRREMRMEPAEWDAVLAALKRKGWRSDEPLHFQIGRKGGTKVGEGNHRLAMARELKLREVPVRFHFYSGKVTKDAQRAKKAEAPPKARPKPAAPRGPIDPEAEQAINDILDLLG